MKSSKPAQSALKKLLLKEFRVLEGNENNIKGGNRAEGLHKFRIAVRKTRSLLRQADSVISERTISKYDREFKYLAQKTCKSRDLDVFLKTLDKFRLSMHDIPLELHNEIYKYIYNDKINEEKKLLEYLHSARYTRLKNDWKKILNKPAANNNNLNNVDISIDYVLKKGINSLYKKMLEQGNNIDINTPCQKYHDLRKTCKKLRYLLEYFNDLHTKKNIKSLIKALKNVQDILGDLQDKRIQIELLDNFMKSKKQNNSLSDEAVYLIEFLIKTLDEQCLEIKTVYPYIYNELLDKFNKKNCSNIIVKNKIANNRKLAN